LEPEKIDGGKKNVFQFALKLVGRFFIFLAALVLIGWLVLTKMENILQKEIENFVATYAAITAQIATERFNGEMMQMERYARQSVTPDNLQAEISRQKI